MINKIVALLASISLFLNFALLPLSVYADETETSPSGVEAEQIDVGRSELVPQPSLEPSSPPQSTNSSSPKQTLIPEPSTEADFNAELLVVPSAGPAPAPVSPWQGASDGFTTIGNVLLNHTYSAPQNDKVTVNFTKLPENPGTLTIKQVTLSKEQQLSLGAFSDTAYDITSTMQDGTFEYNLTLPLPDSAKDKEVEVKSTQSLDDLENAKKVDQHQEKKSDTVTITGLNHFTLFVVTTVTEFNNGTSSNTTVTDVGSGDGSVTNTLGGETQDQFQTTGNTQRGFDNTNWISQTFTAGQSGFLTKVIVRLDRNNSSNTDGNVSVELRNTSSGAPGATVLASATLAATSVNKNGATNYDFTFSNPEIVSGTVYAIVIHRSGSSGTLTADFNWFSDTNGNNSYTNGGRYTSSNSGSSWSLQNSGNGDLRFQTYYKAYPTSGTQTSDVLDTNSTSTKFSQISWSESLPSGTDITFEVRASNTSFAKGDASPSWTSLGTANSPISLSNALPNSYQYFQWRATFSGTTTATPTLQDVTVTYDRQPNTPTLSSPENGATVTTATPTLTWTAASPIDPDSSDTVTYQVQVDNNSDFSSLEYNFSNLSTTSTTTSALSEGTYYWRVLATDNNNYSGNWTNSRSFTVRTTGDIVIVKDSNPDNAQDFSFSTTGVGLSSFSLDDDLDNTLSNQRTFSTITPGSYTVSENGVNGWSLTDLSCSDPDNGTIWNLDSRTATIDIDAGETVTCTFTNTKLGSISGFKFEDTDGDGVWDENEDPLSDWTINLSGAATNDTTTDEDGYYLFEELLPGTYHVCETLEEGWMQTLPSNEFTCGDGTSGYEIELSAGENVESKDFGNFRQARISGQKFNDLDGNGIKDSGEPGLEGWTIFLDANDNGELDCEIVNEDGSCNGGEISTTTDSEGNYQFSGLTAGIYKVREVLQDGWVQTTSNPSGITVTSGTTQTGVDFGNFQKVTITGTKWKDLDADGTKDVGEPGIGNWGMNLSRVTTSSFTSETSTVPIEIVQLSLVSTTQTNENGQFSFNVTSPGTYRITEESRDGFQKTSPTDSFFDVFVNLGGQTLTTDKNNHPLRFGNAPFVQQFSGTKFVPTSGDSSSTTSLVVLGSSDITVSQNGGSSTVTLPNGVVITRSDGGTIDSSLLSAQDVSVDSLSGLGTGVVADGALQWGITNLGLEFSTPITLSIFVGAAFNGQTLNVIRSTSASSGWSSDGIVAPATCVVTNGLCTFQATKASFYATTHNTSSNASTSSTSSDGGGGGGGVAAPACGDSAPGSAPTLISATYGINTVTLTWSQAASPVTYYLVTYGLASGQQLYGNPNVGGPDTTSYTISGLSGGTKYYFKVRAGNGCAPGDYSNELSVTPGGAFIAQPAVGFIPGVLGEREEEVKAEQAREATPEPISQPTPIAPSPLKLLFDALGGVVAAVAGFFTRLLGR